MTTTDQPFFQRRATWGVALALLVLVAGSTWAVLHKGTPPSVALAPPVQVTTAPVKQQTVQVYRSGIGTVSSMATVTVKARIDGALDKVGFTEGQDVKAG